MNKALPVALTILVLLTSYGCKKKNIQSDNPLVRTEWDTPHGVPDWTSIRGQHFVPGVKAGMIARQAAADSINANTGTPSFENVIVPFDRSGRLLERNLSVFTIFHNLNQNDEADGIYAEIKPLLAAHYDDIYHNAQLFSKVSHVYDSRFESRLDTEQIRLVELTYDEFVRRGAKLSETDKAELKEINIELAQLEAKFSGNLRKATDDFRVIIGERDKLSNIPNQYMTNASREAERAGYKDKWIFTLKNSSRIPFLTYYSAETSRSEVYNAYVDRANLGDEYDNNSVAEGILKLRQEKAKIFGYHTYARYRNSGSSTPDPEGIIDFLDKVWYLTSEKATDITTELTRLRSGSDTSGIVEPWDYWYYKDRLNRTRYATTQENLATYFSLDNVVSGMLSLANRLWGITFRPTPAPVYNTEWAAYEVTDIDDTPLGVVYLDMVSRPGKKDGYWCVPVINQRYDDTTRVSPVVIIGADFPPAASGNPVNLTLQQTKECFALFGEALSYVLSDVRYESLSRPDANALPIGALIMQKWALHPAMLDQYAKKFRTNEPISAEFIELINSNRAYESIPALASFMSSAYLDINAYSISGTGDFSPDAVQRGAMSEKVPLAFPSLYRLTDFEPIFSGDKAAIFYTYLKADIMACDAFEAFAESKNIFDRDIAVSLRENVFSKGNSVTADEKHLGFRGTMPDMQPFMISIGIMERPEQEETGVDPLSLLQNEDTPPDPAALPAPGTTVELQPFR